MFRPEPWGSRRCTVLQYRSFEPHLPSSTTGLETNFVYYFCTLSISEKKTLHSISTNQKCQLKYLLRYLISESQSLGLSNDLSHGLLPLWNEKIYVLRHICPSLGPSPPSAFIGQPCEEHASLFQLESTKTSTPHTPDSHGSPPESIASSFGRTPAASASPRPPANVTPPRTASACDPAQSETP